MNPNLTSANMYNICSTVMDYTVSASYNEIKLACIVWHSFYYNSGFIFDLIYNEQNKP